MPCSGSFCHELPRHSRPLRSKPAIRIEPMSAHRPNIVAAPRWTDGRWTQSCQSTVWAAKSGCGRIRRRAQRIGKKKALRQCLSACRVHGGLWEGRGRDQATNQAQCFAKPEAKHCHACPGGTIIHAGTRACEDRYRGRGGGCDGTNLGGGFVLFTRPCK